MKTYTQLLASKDERTSRVLFEQLLACANQGEVQAIVQIGLCFDKGIYVNQDSAEAVLWFTKAAEQECVEAIYNLANTLQRSTDLAIQNLPKALEWFVKGAKLGDTSTASRIADLAKYLYDISTKDRVFFVKGIEFEDLQTAVAEVYNGEEKALMQYLKLLWIAEYGKAIHVATKENNPLSLSYLCDCISTNREFLFLVDVTIFKTLDRVD